MQYTKLKKKYSLNNSYFKNTPYGAPSTVLEIMPYYQQHGELPFAYSGDNWIYDAFCERQKRHTIYLSQFLTPDNTAKRIAELVGELFTVNEPITDACCGTGQLSHQLIKAGYTVNGFDIDAELVQLCSMAYPASFQYTDYRDTNLAAPVQLVVSNPPYEDIPAFLEWLHKNLVPEGGAILLIPQGFVDKQRPKALLETLSKFSIIHRESMTEEFARTKVRGEIVGLRKL